MHPGILHSICIPPATTIKQAIQKLNETAQKILLVVEAGGILTGTVTDGDIRRGITDGKGFDEPVSSIMYREYTALSHTVDDMQGRAKTLMAERNLTHVPIIDNEKRVHDVIVFRDILGLQKKSVSQPSRENMVVIMAGGKGTRLDAFTKVLPKPLIPIGEKPAIELIMERFYEYGFRKFIYTLNYKKEYIKLFLKEHQSPYEISWVEEEAFLGTAGSLALLKGSVHETFFVVNCDTLLSIDSAEALAWHKTHGAPLTVIGAHTEVNIPFGVLALGNGNLESIQEKPNHDVMINTGMYIMEPRALSFVPDNAKMDMNELINLIAKEERVAVYPIYGRVWLDIGQWDHYHDSMKRLEGRDSSYV